MATRPQVENNSTEATQEPIADEINQLLSTAPINRNDIGKRFARLIALSKPDAYPQYAIPVAHALTHGTGTIQSVGIAAQILTKVIPTFTQQPLKYWIEHDTDLAELIDAHYALANSDQLKLLLGVTLGVMRAEKKEKSWSRSDTFKQLIHMVHQRQRCLSYEEFFVIQANINDWINDPSMYATVCQLSEIFKHDHLSAYMRLPEFTDLTNKPFISQIKLGIARYLLLHQLSTQSQHFELALSLTQDEHPELKSYQELFVRLTAINKQSRLKNILGYQLQMSLINATIHWYLKNYDQLSEQQLLLEKLAELLVGIKHIAPTPLEKLTTIFLDQLSSDPSRKVFAEISLQLLNQVVQRDKLASSCNTIYAAMLMTIEFIRGAYTLPGEGLTADGALVIARHLLHPDIFDFAPEHWRKPLWDYATTPTIPALKAILMSNEATDEHYVTAAIGLARCSFASATHNQPWHSRLFSHLESAPLKNSPGKSRVVLAMTAVLYAVKENDETRAKTFFKHWFSLNSIYSELIAEPSSTSVTYNKVIHTDGLVRELLHRGWISTLSSFYDTPEELVTLYNGCTNPHYQWLLIFFDRDEFLVADVNRHQELVRLLGAPSFQETLHKADGFNLVLNMAKAPNAPADFLQQQPVQQFICRYKLAAIKTWITRILSAYVTKFSKVGKLVNRVQVTHQSASDKQATLNTALEQLANTESLEKVRSLIEVLESNNNLHAHSYGRKLRTPLPITDDIQLIKRTLDNPEIGLNADQSDFTINLPDDDDLQCNPHLGHVG